MRNANLIPFIAKSIVIGCMALSLPTVAQKPEPDCPHSYFYCGYYFGSLFTWDCEGPLCFSKNTGLSATVIATDDSGFFPQVWNFWSDGELQPATDPYHYTCDVRDNGNQKNKAKSFHKYKVTIPEPPQGMHDYHSCQVEVHRGAFIYHHIFISDPDAEFLCWVECEEYVPDWDSGQINSPAIDAENE